MHVFLAQIEAFFFVHVFLAQDKALALEVPRRTRSSRSNRHKLYQLPTRKGGRTESLRANCIPSVKIVALLNLPSTPIVPL